MDITKYEKIWSNSDWSDADIFIYRNRETGLFRGEVYIETLSGKERLTTSLRASMTTLTAYNTTSEPPRKR